MSQTTICSGSVEVPGATLRYVVEGTGLPVLVVGSATYYPRTFSQRLRNCYTLAFTDLRHFVPSQASFDFDQITFETYADDIECVRVALGFDKCVIVGHSKHGNIGLEYAKRYPQKVTHVVLIGSPPCALDEVVRARAVFWNTQALHSRKEALTFNMRALTPRLGSLSASEKEVVRYLADGPMYWYDAAFDASTLWQGMHVNSETLDKLHSLFEGYELAWNPTDLQVPILVVMGRFDFAVPHLLWDNVLPRLQNVAYHVFDRSGHTPQLEEQERFDQVFLEWLERVSGKTDFDSLSGSETDDKNEVRNP